jgi:hypothetical protein
MLNDPDQSRCSETGAGILKFERMEKLEVTPEFSAGDFRAFLNRAWPTGMGILIVLLTPLAWHVLMRYAVWEPYATFSETDLFWQVVVATALLVVFVEMAGIILLGMFVRRLSAWWFIALPWLAVLIVLLLASIGAWSSDMATIATWRAG